jgi:fructokinase
MYYYLRVALFDWDCQGKPLARAMQKTILSFGETLWDLLPSGPVLGGAPFNLACRINALGDRGLIVTRLGRDDYGRQALDQMRALGMDSSHVQRDDHHPTGTVQVSLDRQYNPEFFIVPEVAYDFIDVTYEALELAAAADVLCFGTLAQRAPTSRETLYRLMGVAGKGLKFLDLNLRRDCYGLETITESLKRASILKMNLQEAHYLAELFEISLTSLPDFCTEMIENWSLSGCLVTLGKYGTFAVSAGKERVYLPGLDVNVVDTCGSGDAFSAGFIHEYLRHKPLADCCRFGNLLGALAATRRGGTAPISPGEIERFAAAKHHFIREPKLEEFLAA